MKKKCAYCGELLCKKQECKDAELREFSLAYPKNVDIVGWDSTVDGAFRTRIGVYQHRRHDVE